MSSVGFNKNNGTQKYLLVTAFFENEPCSIVKLGFNDAGIYWEEARYPVDFPVAGITFVSGGGSNPAILLLKSGTDFFEASLSGNKPNGQSITMSTPKLSISYNSYMNVSTHQGAHYEPSEDKLYLTFSGGSSGGYSLSVIRVFNNISSSSGTNNEADAWLFMKNGYYEIEGAGFQNNGSIHRLCFNTMEGESVNGCVYIDLSI